MDQSYSDSDVTLSPSQILERLHVLRQLQLLQRGKLQRQRLEYHDSPEITSSITEIVSHFSNSTSYNTFRSLLQSSEASNEIHSNSEPMCVNLTRKDDIQNAIEGVSVLNLSEASEFELDTPKSSKSSAKLSHEKDNLDHSEQNLNKKKQIALDDVPILSPKKDFESLIVEKLKNQETHSTNINSKISKSISKPYLKRGEGMARFGLQKNKLVIQNTKSLPWRKKKINQRSNNKETQSKDKENKSKTNNTQTEISVDKTKNISPLNKSLLPSLSKKNMEKNMKQNVETNEINVIESKQPNVSENAIDKSLPKNSTDPLYNGFVKGKQPSVFNKEKTWASVLTKEQDEFLRQLKQSTYYKNFMSPVKSTVSDISCDENHSTLLQERETAEQNMFELLENKVSHESFNINNSFLNRFLRHNNLECSGESTPVVMQKCLSKNPNLLHLLPNVGKDDITCTDVESCYSECSDCKDENLSVSECCSCKNPSNISVQTSKSKEVFSKNKVNLKKKKQEKECQNDSKSSENEILNKNMVEMNAKLVATSELLKDRLRELEDEIETFRKENTNLTKMKEDIELERQKFNEEKTSFEQKFNEEKILSEYYLAEEKEKLSKQKQMYERYVRDMRGRLNKKEKDEVIHLKKEINDLREEIRTKDAKSTSIIARLRNQLKIIEKDKKNLEDKIEKLEKENRRIQHSNDVTRRLTNLKYLEEINKKLNTMATKDKSYEIERQSRGRNVMPIQRGVLRPRAKSVPNLKVTSRYAKYFSQKDSLSEREKNKTFNQNLVKAYTSNNDLPNSDDENLLDNCEHQTSDSDEDNNLEKMYNDRFKSISPTSKRSSINSSSRSTESLGHMDNNNDFFLKRTNSTRSSAKHSPNQSNLDSQYLPIQSNLNKRGSLAHSENYNGRKSPSREYYENCDTSTHYQRTKSPVSILSNRSSFSQKTGTVVMNKAAYCDTRMMASPEPTASKTSLTKTNLNPMEIRKPDGSKEIRFPNGNVKIIAADGKYSKFVYYNGDIKENFYNEGRIKYYYAETKTYHTTHPDGLEVLEFPDGQVEKRYKDGSTEIRLPNGSIRYFDPKNEHVREEWRFPDGAALTVSADGDQRIVFANGQIEVHAKDHKRREFPDGTVKLVYNDGTAETRYASGRVRIKDKHGNLLMDSATGQ